MYKTGPLLVFAAIVFLFTISKQPAAACVNHYDEVSDSGCVTSQCSASCATGGGYGLLASQKTANPDAQLANFQFQLSSAYSFNPFRRNVLPAISESFPRYQVGALPRPPFSQSFSFSPSRFVLGANQ
jgi:hypothetical protein